MLVYSMNRERNAAGRTALDVNNFHGSNFWSDRRGLPKQTTPVSVTKTYSNHLDIPIFGEEGDVLTFIYIVEG